MTDTEILVVGAGPGGSSAAWRAATQGRRVLLVDRAEFPRDKPCGDGLTPRGVKLLTDMGLGADLERFHRIDGFRLVTRFGTQEQRWAHSDVGLPDHAYVCRRTELDQMLLDHARAAGSEVRCGVTVSGALVERGRVVGVETGDGEQIRAKVVVAADGATSRLARAAGLTGTGRGVAGYAARIEVPLNRPDDHFMEVYPELLINSQLVPAYGWVFPLGQGTVNLGVGFITTSRSWRDIRLGSLLTELLDRLPPAWAAPSATELLALPGFQGWKLPMGISVESLWRPGLVLCGDAAGVAKPFTGAGISKAIQSGLLAGIAADRAIAADDPFLLEQYQREVEALWGRSHRLGTWFGTAIGSPRVMQLLVRTLGTQGGAHTVHRFFSQAVRRRQPQELRA